MARFCRVLIGVSVVSWAMVAACQAEIVTPVAATASSSFAVPPDALIDGSGLNGVGNVEDQLHDTNENNMWIAGSGSQAQNEELVFVLDQNYDLSEAIIWQYNGLNAFGDNSLRGVSDFEILISPDLNAPFTSIGTFGLDQATPVAPPDEPAQTKVLTGATNARRVKFDIISAFGGPTFEFVGLSEVRFRGTALPPGPDRSWNVDSFGSWTNDANWEPSFAPNANTHTATFGGVITAPRTVVTDQPVTVKAVTFANANSYVIAGAGSVNLDADTGNASISVAGGSVAGTHQFQAVVNLLDPTTADVATGSTLVFNNALNLNGNMLTKTGGGTLLINNQQNAGGGNLRVANGVLGGSGTVGGNLENIGAEVAPGNSTGILTVNGNYVQNAAATLAMEVAGSTPGSGHDQLAVVQAAQLDGSLVIDVLPAYADPVARGDYDDLVLIVANSVIGGFDLVEYGGQPLAAGSNYVGENQNGDDGLFRVFSQSSTEVKVTNYLALPGDANGDLAVDGSDFSIWNAHKFTAGTDWSTGDFNGDGTTDGSDFSIWNTNKFTRANSASLVPEPTVTVSFCLALLGLSRGGSLRRRA